MDLQFRNAAQLVRRTVPYVLYRLKVYAAFCGTCVAYLLVLSFIGQIFGIGAFWSLAAISVALGVTLGVPKLVSEYMFATVRAGHVALVNELAAETELPAGVSQIKWANEQINETFKTPTALAHCANLARATLHEANYNVFAVSKVMSAPGVENAPKFALRMAELSVPYGLEAVLGYVLSRRKEGGDPLAATKTGLLYYCQGWEDLLSKAVRLTLIGYCFLVLATVVLLVPFGILALPLPEEWGALKFVLFLIAIALAGVVKATLYDPAASAVLSLSTIAESETFAPDPVWESRLREQCPSFRAISEELERRAEQQEKPKPKRTRRTTTT
jgi:hypothetical protein